MLRYPVPVLLMCCAPTIAQATVDCRLIDMLTRIGTSELTEERLATGQMPPDISGLEMTRIDPAAVAFALATHPNAAEALAVTRFAGLVEAITTAAERSDDRRLGLLLQSPDSRSTLRQALAVMARMGCEGVEKADETAAVAGMSDEEEAPAAAPEDQATGRGRITESVPLAPLALGLAGATIATALVLFLRKRSETNRRRARRYALNRRIRMRTSDAEAVGRMLDISCVGAKIRHDNQINGAQSVGIELELDGRWHQARISWHNAHYVGVAFLEPIRFANLLRILAGSGDGAAINTLPRNGKTAPQGAPLKP